MSDLKDYFNEFCKKNPNYKIIVTISTTSFKEKDNLVSYTSYPKLVSTDTYLFHIIFINHIEANDFINFSKHKIFLFFIDIENKNSLFNPNFIIDANPDVQFNNLQPNSLTVDAIIYKICSKKDSSVMIVGSGNIALLTCIRLKLLNWKFFWFFDQNIKSKSKELMNKIFKSEYLDERNIKFDFIFNTVPTDLNIDFNKNLKKNSIFFEVTGKSFDFLENLNCKCLRLDVSNFLIAEIKRSLFLKKNKLSYGRKKVGNNYICSGGCIGKKNDIIVDNLNKPKFIIGVSDGKGGFKKRLNIEYNLKTFDK